eukprot:530705-Amphidinium_carterae.1
MSRPSRVQSQVYVAQAILAYGAETEKVCASRSSVFNSGSRARTFHGPQKLLQCMYPRTQSCIGS